METIHKSTFNHKKLVNNSNASLSECRDGGHCKYCIKGTNYSN